MTKTQVNITTKSPEYTALDMKDASTTQPQIRSTTCWYVWGILSTIFCCFPCGVIGLVHAMIAKHEGERGNFAAHRRRLYQAKCWTSWSITLGLLVVLGVIIFFLTCVGFRRYSYDDDFYNNDYWYGYGNVTDSYNSTHDYYPEPVMIVN